MRLNLASLPYSSWHTGFRVPQKENPPTEVGGLPTIMTFKCLLFCVTHLYETLFLRSLTASILACKAVFLAHKLSTLRADVRFQFIIGIRVKFILRVQGIPFHLFAGVVYFIRQVLMRFPHWYPLRISNPWFSITFWLFICYIFLIFVLIIQNYKISANPPNYFCWKFPKIFRNKT